MVRTLSPGRRSHCRPDSGGPNLDLVAGNELRNPLQSARQLNEGRPVVIVPGEMGDRTWDRGRSWLDLCAANRGDNAQDFETGGFGSRIISNEPVQPSLRDLTMRNPESQR